MDNPWLPFELPHLGLLDFNMSIYTAGSCFSVNIGEQLQTEGFDTMQHPFGIVYSPWAMLRQFERMLEGRLYTRSDLHCEQEIWYSYDHHSVYADTDPDRCLNKINADLLSGSKAIRHAGLLMLTFGSARTFCLASNGLPVANCHRSPAAGFLQKMANPEEMTAAYLALFSRIRQHNPEIRIMLTVSPVRHIREGLVQNNRSKARMFQLVESLCEQAEGVYYFPAYEILLDVLRDYRWYGDDMTHPSKAAVSYIYDAFMQSAANEETLRFSERMRRYKRDTEHRPRFPETAAYRDFQLHMNQNREALLHDYPVLENRGFFDPAD
jgi:hypothetical protein